MAESEVAVLRRLIFKESLPGHDHQHRQLYKRFRKQAHDEAEDAAAAMATPTPADEKGLSDLMKLMNVEDFSTFVKDFITSTVGVRQGGQGQGVARCASVCEICASW